MLGLGTIAKKVFGTPNDRKIKATLPLVAKINALEAEFKALSDEGNAVDGIAIRDRREDVEAFLARNGNPFARIGKDDVSAVQLAIGSSGVPESFVIDGKGVIRYQHIGVIRAEDLPLIREKLKEAAQ